MVYLGVRMIVIISVCGIATYLVITNTKLSLCFIFTYSEKTHIA